jgi:hypothetical protein
VVDGELVLMLNVAELCPCGTVSRDTDGIAAVLLLPIVTAWPPAPAGPVKVTVPVDEEPPLTVAGLKVKDDTGTFEAGFTVSVAVCELVP